MGMNSLENRPLRKMPRIWTKAIIRLIVSLPHHRMRNALHTTYMTSCESLVAWSPMPWCMWRYLLSWLFGYLSKCVFTYFGLLFDHSYSTIMFNGIDLPCLNMQFKKHKIELIFQSS